MEPMMLSNPTNDPRVIEQVNAHPHHFVFASLSGAHLYGFPSPDSDVDIRGVHVLEPQAMLGLAEPDDTYELMDVVDGLEVDVVTYDLKKFCQLLVNKNGNVLEQVVSPLVVATTAEHDELRELANRCVTRHHAHHYRGMTKNRLRAFEESREVKPLLYAFRAALTGIHLMKTGECQPNLLALLEPYDVESVKELVEQKSAAEHAVLQGNDGSHWRAEVEKLLVRLEDAFQRSTLPENPEAADAVDDFLVRVRMKRAQVG